MSPASRRAPQGATTPGPPLVDWHPYEYALSWLERVRALLEDSGGCTAEDQRLINAHARALLVASTSPLDEPPVWPIPPPLPVPAPKPDRCCGRCRLTVPVRWSLNDRLQALGYPEDLDRSTRIKLGQAVVDAYRQVRGKAPAVADQGRGTHATRVSLYDEADLPLVDEVVRGMLGEPPVGEAAEEIS